VARRQGNRNRAVYAYRSSLRRQADGRNIDGAVGRGHNCWQIIDGRRLNASPKYERMNCGLR